MINDMQAAYMFMSVSVIERLFHRNRVYVGMLGGCLKLGPV